MSPLDLERTFGLIGGDIFHRALSLNQLFILRPMLGQANYRWAIAGLYLCGSDMHPGGSVTGALGYNAALRDSERKWPLEAAVVCSSVANELRVFRYRAAVA